MIKFAKSREVEGRIINTTIRRNPSVNILHLFLLKPKHRNYLSMHLNLLSDANKDCPEKTTSGQSFEILNYYEKNDVMFPRKA